MPDRCIEDPKDPIVRRLADVMRSATAKPRTLIVDDEENIAQAVDAGVEIDSLYAAAETDIAAELRARIEAPLHLLDEQVMKGLFKAEKRARVFALARAPMRATLDDLAVRDGDLVVLDGVRLAGNIGAIVRSARAFGAAGIVLLDSGLTHVFDRRLIRASRGLVFSLPIVLAEEAELVAFLRAHNIPLASLAADGDAELASIGDTTERFALLMGSERLGASASLEGLAERRLSVPMSPGVESLNVSVAAGIALYERRRAR